MFSNRIYHYFILLLMLISIDNFNVNSIKFIQPNQCSKNEYFNSITLSCLTCRNYLKNFFTNQTNLILESFSNDKTECWCPAQHRMVSFHLEKKINFLILILDCR